MACRKALILRVFLYKLLLYVGRYATYPSLKLTVHTPNMHSYYGYASSIAHCGPAQATSATCTTSKSPQRYYPSNISDCSTTKNTHWTSKGPYHSSSFSTCSSAASRSSTPTNGSPRFHQRRRLHFSSILAYQFLWNYNSDKLSYSPFIYFFLKF